MSTPADRMRIATRAAKGTSYSQASPPTAARREELIQISARITPEAHRGLRMVAARANLSVAATIQVIGLLCAREDGDIQRHVENAAELAVRQWGGRRT